MGFNKVIGTLICRHNIKLGDFFTHPDTMVIRVILAPHSLIRNDDSASPFWFSSIRDNDIETIEEWTGWILF